MSTPIFVISKANSMRYVETTSLGCEDGQTFDNTLVCSEEVGRGNTFGYAQKFKDCMIIPTQIRSNYATITAELFDIADNKLSDLVVTKVGDYTDYDYFEFEVDIPTEALADGFYYVEVNGSDVDPDLPDVEFFSEPFEVASSFDNTVIIEFTNYDSAFDIDYLNNTINNFIVVEGDHFKYQPGGEIDVYDNQSVEEKLQEETKRVITLRAEMIPRYLAEKIKLAFAHDYVLVNGVQFVSKANPQIEDNESNLVNLTLDTTQAIVEGINSDDQGLVCSGEEAATVNVKPLRLLDVSGPQTLTLDIDFSILQVIVARNQGTVATVKIGWGVGTDEIMKSRDFSSTDRKTTARSIAPPTDSENTIYIDISGVGATADIYIITVRYEET